MHGLFEAAQESASVSLVPVSTRGHVMHDTLTAAWATRIRVAPRNLQMVGFGTGGHSMTRLRVKEALNFALPPTHNPGNRACTVIPDQC